MKARLKGEKARSVKFGGEVVKFTPGEWTYLPSISFYKRLLDFKDEFDVVCEYDIQPFQKAGLVLSFRGRTVRTSHKPTIRHLDNSPKVVTRQALLPETGEVIYRIKGFNDVYLGAYVSILSQVKVLCFRSKGGIGDIIMTIPSLEAAKRRYPNYQIDYSCPKEYLPLLENCPFINKLIPLGEADHAEYHVVYDMTRKCIEYEGRTMPAVDLNRTEIFAKVLGFEPKDVPRPKLFLSREEIYSGLYIDLGQTSLHSSLTKRSRVENDRLLIGVCVDSSAAVRSYPYAEELIDMLSVNYSNAMILFFDNSGEYDFKHDNVYVFSRLPLREVLTIISRCDIFVGPDTGLSHMAASLRVPTLWWFTHTDGLIRTRGYEEVKVIQGGSPPCPLGRPCWYEFPCDPELKLRDTDCSLPCRMNSPPSEVLLQVDKVVSVPLLSIVVVCHNQIAYTKQCISNILEAKKFSDEVILIDNGSTDGTQEYFSRMESIEYYRLSSNTGCVSARNLGIELAKGRFVLFLDNDQFISYYTLDELKRGEGDIVGVEGWWIDDNGLAYPHHRVGMLNYVGAGGMLAKREMLLDLEKFDETYSPAWFEDPDLCLTAAERGYTVGLVEDAGIKHVGHATNHTQKTFDSQEVWKRNREYFIMKWAERRKSPLVSIVILTHNDSDSTIRCLESIYRTSDMDLIEVIVVDNGSNGEESAKLLFYEKPKLRVFYNEKNIMVAAGRNMGALQANGENILFLDNDMVLPEGWMAGLLSTLDETNAVATSPVIVDKTPRGDVVRFVATVIEDGRMKEVKDRKHRRCDFLPGGALLVRRALFEEFSFDEKYVYGVEDYDWCMRVKKAGYIFLNTPSVTFLHMKMKPGRTINKYDEEERIRKGSSFIEDSVRLFLHRYHDELPNQWNEPGWLALAIGKDRREEVTSRQELMYLIGREVNRIHADEFREER
jgi:GT2 family glycosyltransferase